MLRIAVSNWQSAFSQSQNIFTAEVAKDTEKKKFVAQNLAASNICALGEDL
jgi:hypothetical protein